MASATHCKHTSRYPQKAVIKSKPSERKKIIYKLKTKKKLNNLNNNLCEVCANSDRSFDSFRNKTYERDKTLLYYQDWEI